jgi:hypothetical protein
MLLIDFETKSACDLKKHGVYNYAQDRSTEVLCMSYAFDDEDVQTWTPEQPFPDRVRNFKGQIRAHNAAFERLIFWYVLGINFKLEQFYCTATQARANCLPGSLEDIGRAMSAKMKKDHRGKQLIRQCCVPPYNTALLPELIHYCEQDVRAMREVSLALRQLSDDELLDYHVNERINDKGLLVDVPLCHAAIGYATAELEDIQTLVKDITGIASARSPKLKQWVADRVDPELMMVEDKLSLNKATRTALLQMDLPNEVLDVVQCIDDISASSVAKFKRMAELADIEDGRVRGAFVFNGGSATGRACVASDTLVMTDKGEVPISSLNVGENVLTHMGRLCKISHVIYKGLEDMYRVQIGNSWVDCTKNHMILTSLGWTYVNQLISIKQSRNSCRSNTAFYIPTISNYGASRRSYKTNSRYSWKNSSGNSASRNVKNFKGSKLLQIENGRKEPYVWGKNSSRNYFTQRLPLSMARRRKAICSTPSVNIDGCFKPKRMARKLGGSSYRWNKNKQFFRQSSNSNKDWASATSFSEIKEIICLGKKGVWDIAVERDGSYVAQGLIHHNSSYGVQLQNMARICAKDPVAVRSAMMAGDDLSPFGTRVTNVLKGMIRPAIIPAKGNVLVVADWAGIEARCNPWLSNHVASEAKLDIFRSGGDVYVENAKSTFNVKEVTKDQRFIGKVQELALGYSGGAGAFASMARIYGLEMPEHQIKRMINGWRVANPWCIPYGQELERAYMSAMRHKGHEFSAGRVTYLFDGNHLWYILPSGRILCYPFARIDDGAVTYCKAAFKPASDAEEWPRARLWQGIAQENCAQATANDLLRYSLRQLDNVIAHIHDEIVVECKADDAEETTKRMISVMCTPPVWAEGIPLDVEIATMARYGK